MILLEFVSNSFHVPHRSTLCRPDRLSPQPPQTRQLKQQSRHWTLQTPHRDRPHLSPSSLHRNQIQQTCSTTDSLAWNLQLRGHWIVSGRWTVLMALDLMGNQPIDAWLQSPFSSFLIAQVKGIHIRVHKEFGVIGRYISGMSTSGIHKPQTIAS